MRASRDEGVARRPVTRVAPWPDVRYTVVSARPERKALVVKAVAG
jgi:hypothetical protein